MATSMSVRQQFKLMIRHQHIETVTMINSSTSLQSVAHWLIEGKLILKIEEFSLIVFALGEKMISVLLFIFSPTIASNRFFGFRRIEKGGRNELNQKHCNQQYPHFFLAYDWWIKGGEPVGITL